LMTRKWFDVNCWKLSGGCQPDCFFAMMET